MIGGTNGERVMVSYWVRYRGKAADPAAFVAYYEKTHSPILRRFPGIRALSLHTPVDFRDPFQVHGGDTMLLAQMSFDSPAELNLALASEARKVARDDFQRFPDFQGDVTHEALEARLIF